MLNNKRKCVIHEITVINHFTPKSAGSKFEKKSLNFNMQNQQKQRVKHESAA